MSLMFNQVDMIDPSLSNSMLMDPETEDSSPCMGHLSSVACLTLVWKLLDSRDGSSLRLICLKIFPGLDTQILTGLNCL